MSFLFLTTIGLLATILVKSAWSQKEQVFFIILSLILGLITYLGIKYIFETTDIVPKMGDSSFLSKIPWLKIGLFFCMIGGMASKYFYDAIGNRNKVVFKKWQFFKPMLISPIIFGTIYGGVNPDTSPILLLIFAFQNGFFWQTILNKTAK